MKLIDIKIPIIASILFLISATVYAEDGNISVEPSYVLFKKITAEQQSDPFSIMLMNTGSATMGIGLLDLKGFGSNDFTLSSDGCSNTTLIADDNCTVEAKLTPDQNGSIKNAWIDIPYTASGSTEKHLSVFMTSKEDIPHEVRRRLQPTISSIDMSNWMDAIETYDLNWSVIGYHDGYKVKMVMFDCTGEAAGECGDDYANNTTIIKETNFLDDNSSEKSGWHYRGEDAYKYSFDGNITVPEFRNDGSNWDPSGTPIVIRFYIVSDNDENAGKTSISLIIPGNLSDQYYDTSGRKIQKHICPVGGCYQ